MSVVLIFIVCYMLDKIWSLTLRDPPLWLVRLVTWVIGLFLVLFFTYSPGPITIG